MPAICCARRRRDAGRDVSKGAGGAAFVAQPRPGLIGRIGRRLRALRPGGDRLIRSAGVRFGIIYAGLFGISALALAAFLWWSTAGLLDRETDNAIVADAQGLAERFGEGGVPALIDTIDQRLASNVDDDEVYLLVDRDMNRLAGNLEAWPHSVTMDQVWAQIAVNRAGIRALSRVRVLEVEGGFHLLIGRDVQTRLQLRRVLADAMLWAAGIAVALGSVGAWTVRGLFSATLADVSATATAVSAGDLNRRVKVTGQGDEFDLLAETINDMLDRIARLMDGVRQVSNAIAHDLRTPITRARTRLEDAAIHAGTEGELRAAIERAQQDLDGIVAVFQALLRIAEIEAGSRRSAFAVFDLAPVLQDLAELYDAAAEETGHCLECDTLPELRLFGDRDMIQQAVANLLDNAMKFAPIDTAIRLSASVTAEGVRIVVADSGPGIPASEVGNATERFFRGEQSRSTPGSGLGLSLVLAVAQLHGGTLRLEDNGPGLRAVLRLPIADNRLAV
jgi:signal transduction histidine kinase